MAERRWARFAPRWQQDFSMRIARPNLPDCTVPWLTALTVHGEWGVGCVACAMAKLPGTYAGFRVRTVAALAQTNFKKHERPACHAHAAKPIA